MKREPYLINSAFNSYIFATILAAVATNMGLVVDGVIVGNLLGADGLSAVNLATPLSQFYLTFQLWLNAGVAMLTAESIGRGDKKMASSYFTFTLLCNLAIGFIFIVCGIFGGEFVTGILCSNEQLMPMTLSYVKIMLLTAPLYLILPGLAVFVRSDGSPKLASASLIIANVINLGCDVLFIKYLDMGIAGAAWATAAGFFCGVIISCSHLFKPLNSLSFRFNFSKISYGRVFSIGLAPALWSLLMTLRIFSINHIVLSVLGVGAISVFAVCYNMQRIISLLISGSSQTLQPVGSLLIGLGDKTGLRLAINKAQKTLIQLLIVTCVVIFAFPKQIAEIFGLNNAALIEQSIYAVRIVTLSFILFGVTYLIIIIMQLTKRLTLSIFISSAQALAIIPIMYAFAHVTADLIWWSFPSSDV